MIEKQRRNNDELTHRKQYAKLNILEQIEILKVAPSQKTTNSAIAIRRIWFFKYFLTE
jgi:hypothetical protein